MRHFTPRLSGNAREKMNIFKDIALKNLNSIESISFDSLKNVLSWRIEHFKKIIFEGQGFRGGSDEKMRRMWLGLEIVIAGLPPLVEPNQIRSKRWRPLPSKYFSTFYDVLIS